MLDKAIETYVVVVCTPLGRGNYKIELRDGAGDVYELTVHEEMVLDYRLVVGKELNQETVSEIQNSKDYQKAYSYAINVLSRRMYSEKELEWKLIRREIAPHVIDDVITKLVEIELLNDTLYATAYIETQVERGKKSQRRIIYELRDKGVSKNIIDDLMHLFDRESELAALSREVAKICKGLLPEDLYNSKTRKKIIRNLAHKGFDFEDVKRQYAFFLEDLEVDDNE